MLGVDTLQLKAEASAAIFCELLPLFESGVLKIDEPEQIRLENAIDAYRRLEHTSGHKMVLVSEENSRGRG